MATTTRTPRLKLGASREDRLQATADYLAHRGPEARRLRAQERQQANQGRTPQQRLQALNARLGPGVGARSERACIARMTAPSPRRAAKA